MNIATISSYICLPDYPIVQTKQGKLRGFVQNGVFTFRGVPYAVARRFHAPQLVQEWDGIHNAQDYGHVSHIPAIGRSEGDTMNPHRYWHSGDDCQNLNVWTSKLDPERRKPVMFWIHGGGFNDGSSIEMYAYDGTNLAKDEDVVVVSVNHRLNLLGYLDLSDYGEEYAQSGIAGMLDLVMALRWAHENIAAFGGDPDNVTLFGQSGGGGKIQALMQMPSADGLYHKAIIQSGVLDLGPLVTKEAAKNTAAEILEKLDVTVRELEDLPYEVINAAVDEIKKQRRVDWAPVPGVGEYEGSWDVVGFRPETRNIPVIVGSVFAEFEAQKLWAYKDEMSDAQLFAVLEQRYGAEHVPQLLEAFRRAYPELPEYYCAHVDVVCRLPGQNFLKCRASFTDTPCYNYLFYYISPFMGGEISGHCQELPFVFRNSQYLGVLAGGEGREELQNAVSGAWTAFAKHGVPDCDDIPHWERFHGDKMECMVFSKKIRMEQDFDSDLTALVKQYAKLPPFLVRTKG